MFQGPVCVARLPAGHDPPSNTKRPAALADLFVSTPSCIKVSMHHRIIRARGAGCAQPVADDQTLGTG